MKFSIVTPSYNQGRFIRDCVESVRTQTGPDWEHIVIDAGSTDETLSVLKEYPHLQWTSEKDNGMSDGINKGFLKATGDWVMWLNADDYLVPDALGRVADHARLHPQADVIFGECVFVEKSRKPIRRWVGHPFEFNMLLLCGCYIPSTSTFLRRSIIQAGHLVDLKYKVCMDFEYYLRLSHAGYRFSYLPEALACFRWHESNTSKVFAGRRWEERLEIQRHYLALLHRSWLGNEWVLRALMRAYQVKRVLRRTWVRLLPK
jgi:glycosyltransferase involved in cell wall biosynthesis